MTSILERTRTSRALSKLGRFLAATGRRLAAIWRALPRVEPITGDFEDGPDERSVIFNGRRVVFPVRRDRTDGQ